MGGKMIQHKVSPLTVLSVFEMICILAERATRQAGYYRIFRVEHNDSGAILAADNPLSGREG